ncbi:MAG TPA: hypothetical protein VFT32_04775 [Candidatus Eisenbacteria bacterium]|nr:hypothetical protein [Candidatus Eisenbacteria bacterium]
MRTKPIGFMVAALLVLCSAPSSRAATLDGTLKVGGIVLDEEGDRSAVQETYDVYDGFAVSQVRLDGRFDAGNSFRLDLRDINLDSRQGEFVYRIPRRFKLSAGYDQNRQVFDPARAVNSERKDLKVAADFTAGEWFGVSGSYGRLTRTGDRLAFPAGSSSVLGTSYDNALTLGQITVRGQKGRRGGAVSYQMSDYDDDLSAAAGRKGRVVSARLYTPSPLYDKWTHLLRGAYGVREITDGELDYTFANFQYTGVVQPVQAWQVRYNFEANRVDNESNRLKTDRFQNILDVTYFHSRGRITGGYGYELNDDDRSLTSYRSWRAGATYRHGSRVGVKLDYAGRVKNDEEDLTLLKDVEASRIRASLDLRPADRFSFGGGYTKRERELPDIDVTVDGDVATGYGRYEIPSWGSLGADYTYSNDAYRDLAGHFDTESHIVTGRAELTRLKKLRLAGGVTYLDIGKDLDIEKSAMFVEGAYKLLRGYSIEVRYNVYNYDDYILLDRYYTANVVRINLVYDLKH